jgi:hypothetical protein
MEAGFLMAPVCHHSTVFFLLNKHPILQSGQNNDKLGVARTGNDCNTNHDPARVTTLDAGLCVRFRSVLFPPLTCFLSFSGRRGGVRSTTARSGGLETTKSQEPNHGEGWRRWQESKGSQNGALAEGEEFWYIFILFFVFVFFEPTYYYDAGITTMC